MQIDQLLTEFSKYGLLGVLFLSACYVIFYLYKSNEEKAKVLMEAALASSKIDHFENKTLIENLRKEIDVERKIEREKFYQIISEFQKVVEDNTEVLKHIKNKII